jgi:hypothetical protein
MKHLFVSYKIASKLKELGFNEECLMKWKKEAQDKYDLYYDRDMYSNLENEPFTICSAPLYQQLIDWLETKGYFIEVFEEFGNWNLCIHYYENNDKIEIWKHKENYTNKYEALNKGIEETLKLI